MVECRGKIDSTLAAMFSNVQYSNTYLFYAHMIGQCSIVIRDDIAAPAGVAYATDKYNLYINPILFDEYTLTERLAILKHEMLHILYNHVGRTKNRDRKTWNIATDCAINQQIDINDLPEDCILPKTIKANLNIDVPKNKSSEYYYVMLKNDDKSDDISIEHATWKESEGDADLQKTITKRMIECAQEETIKSKGKIPEDINQMLNINTVKSTINWKKQLRNIIANKKINKITSIKKFDRRFPTRADLRGKTSDRTFDLLIIADVSGSMSDDDVLSTLNEVKQICKLTKTDLNLIQIDTKAHKPEKITQSTQIFKRKGNGGTELFGAIDMANQHKIKYDAVIILTDGYIFQRDANNFTNINKKIIWLISKDGTTPNINLTSKMEVIKLTNV